MAINEEKTIKIIILGSSSVGKTCILQRAFNNEFKESMLSTVGIDFKTKYFKFDDDKVRVNCIDTAGQEKFRAISINYLKGTDGALLVFDITNKETFELITSWLDDIKQNNKMNVGKILIGNKSDLDSERTVTKEEAESFAELIQCKYYETSAKTGENIQEALDEIAKIAYMEWKTSHSNRESLKLSASDFCDRKSVKKGKKGCCGSSS